MISKFKIAENKNGGFTFIETIVAVAIFSLVVVMVVGIFISIIQAQRKGLASQKVQENARYVLEMMAREIRMSEINTAAGLQNSLDITAHKATGDEAILYSLSNYQIMRNGQPITSDQVKINYLGFYVTKNLQPRVTINLQVIAQGGKPSEQAQMNLQTTIVSRSY